MSNAFLQTRTMPRSFGAQGRRIAKTSDSKFQRAEGAFDYFSPDRTRALWFAISPEQAWTYLLYNRESQSVEEIQNSYFYAYTEHTVRLGPKSIRNFVCSAGPHHDKPCWGCGVRNAFYEAQRRQRETTGVSAKGEAPIGGGQRYALSGAVLEYHVRKQKIKDGRPQTTKQGQAIMTDIPLPLLERAERKRAKSAGNVVFGKRVHWSFGINALNELLELDDRLHEHCTNCGGGLHAKTVYCPSCAETFPISDEGEDALAGEDLTEARREFAAAKQECPSCHDHVVMLPHVECACGKPAPGDLSQFAFRFKNVQVGDKQYKLTVTDVRPLHMFAKEHPTVAELLKPLDLPKIFVPANLGYQTTLIPQHMRGDGVTPDPRRKEEGQEDVSAAEAYDFTGAAAAGKKKKKKKKEAVFVESDDDLLD